MSPLMLQPKAFRGDVRAPKRDHQSLVKFMDEAMIYWVALFSGAIAHRTP